MKYDAIIAGASFAGLAVASRLKGKVLLIDHYNIGSRQTSACATLLRIPRSLDCQDSVLQIHREVYIHLGDRIFKHRLPQAFCTFDFHKFCQGLLRRCGAEFLKAHVLGLKEGRVVTSKGEFEATCIIDATGWRAVLASSVSHIHSSILTRSFGLEVLVPRIGSGLHMWLDRKIVPAGYGWLFPCGSHSRAGIGGYTSSKGARAALKKFLHNLGASGHDIHGGFFPSSLRNPTAGPIFVVGDAAGQCLPLTGEGIRPALFFGNACGDIVQRIIGSKISLAQGLNEYASLVNRYQKGYKFLEFWQDRISRWPWLMLFLLLKTTSLRFLSNFLLSKYVFSKK